MYAIIETGGKQYRACKGDILDIELLQPQEGSQVTFKNVLVYNNGTETKIGLPYVKECMVLGELVSEIKGPKVIAYK